MEGVRISKDTHSLYIPTENEYFFLHVFWSKERQGLTAYTCDRSQGKKRIWLKGQDFPLDGKLEINVCEVTKESLPLEVMEHKFPVIRTKLEMFYDLEKDLKEKGLL